MSNNKQKDKVEQVPTQPKKASLGILLVFSALLGFVGGYGGAAYNMDTTLQDKVERQVKRSLFDAQNKKAKSEILGKDVLVGVELIVVEKEKGKDKVKSIKGYGSFNLLKTGEDVKFIRTGEWYDADTTAIDSTATVISAKIDQNDANEQARLTVLKKANVKSDSSLQKAN